ncbi:P22 phage major capsid protein family protein [Serratia ureilytica]|uniref:P22 phage major capsid protein family protein n=1 Tax=Serratia ureilytica TaxID=300181 RepID=UPI002499D675|nr:P22 phage major capsid protein family protein [Serratia ureilytica]MDI3197128.1 P22 phage major capsid protein family protein [Serratia ureilytica]
MSLNEGQMVTYAVDEVIKTVQNLTPMAQKTKEYTPPAPSMQRSGNTFWLPVEQEAPTQEGWDLTGKETDVLELSVKCNMGAPDNDFFQLRADDLRDERSYRHRINASAKKLANNVEKAIAQQAVDMGSLVVTNPQPISTAAGSGWDFVADAEEFMFARELNRDAGLSFFFNSDDYKKAGHDLVNRDMFGRIPEDAYKNGTIQRQVAGFDDVLRSPKMPTLAASTATGLTVSGAQKFKPEAWHLDADGNKENVDNRIAVVKLSAGAGLKRGDKISFAGVKYLSQMAKNVLTQDATFTVVAVNGANVTIAPKPIALDDTSLTAAERAYANVNTSLADTMAVNILNVKTAKTNVFWADDSIRLVSQPIPATHELFAGMKTESFAIPGVGINGIFATQGDISTLAGKCRIALWYSACAVRPEAIGVGLANQTA